jgi:hypothetical protein
MKPIPSFACLTEVAVWPRRGYAREYRQIFEKTSVRNCLEVLVVKNNDYPFCMGIKKKKENKN